MSEAVQQLDLPIEPVAPAAEPIVAHTETPTILGEAVSPGDVAPVAVEPDPIEAEPTPVEEPAAPAVEEPAPVAEEPKAEEPKPAEPAAEVATPEPAAPVELEPIVYPEWKLADGTKIDGEQVSKFNDILAGARVAPEVGQALLDMHASALQQTVAAMQENAVREQHRVFGEVRQGWRNEVMADPEIGGAGHQTAMGAIARVRDVLVSSARPGTEQYNADMAAFNQALAVTGMGDHPILLKMLHRAARFIDEPGMGPTGIKPPPDIAGKPKNLRDIYKSNREARDGQ